LIGTLGVEVPLQQLPHARTSRARLTPRPADSPGLRRRPRARPLPATLGGLTGPGSSPAQSAQFLLVKVRDSR
jgi:hypothetical protein